MPWKRGIKLGLPVYASKVVNNEEKVIYMELTRMEAGEMGKVNCVPNPNFLELLGYG